jgi:2-polyprenyl-3-methyl-5-hydroxy-6-metoxy-1,4-benzoquinol methylase
VTEPAGSGGQTEPAGSGGQTEPAGRAPWGRSRAPRPGGDLLSLYADAPLAVRAHVRLRWWTCPFRAVEAQVPPSGRVLEVGCGHGVFSVLAAISSPGRSVVGVDVDERKVPHARSAAARARAAGADVDITVAPPGELPEGPWDAIVVVDVAYLLDAATQRRLIADCAARLAPGGILALKEMALEPAWKFRWNRFQETLAVRVLGITVGGEMTFVDPAEMGGWMVDEGLEVRRQPLHKGYPHPHHLVVGRRPA